uniref:Uncharacterized protein n=1 Tax=Arundo donax TaxID=35708 RepID=A0A0A9BH87_ARUDO
MCRLYPSTSGRASSSRVNKLPKLLESFASKEVTTRPGKEHVAVPGLVGSSVSRVVFVLPRVHEISAPVAFPGWRDQP